MRKALALGRFEWSVLVAIVASAIDPSKAVLRDGGGGGHGGGGGMRRARCTV